MAMGAGYGKKMGVGFPYILRKNNKGVFDKMGEDGVYR
jgi:hypothetical protein